MTGSWGRSGIRPYRTMKTALWIVGVVAVYAVALVCLLALLRANPRDDEPKREIEK